MKFDTDMGEYIIEICKYLSTVFTSTDSHYLLGGHLFGGLDLLVAQQCPLDLLHKHNGELSTLGSVNILCSHNILTIMSIR